MAVLTTGWVDLSCSEVHGGWYEMREGSKGITTSPNLLGRLPSLRPNIFLRITTHKMYQVPTSMTTCVINLCAMGSHSKTVKKVINSRFFFVGPSFVLPHFHIHFIFSLLHPPTSLLTWQCLQLYQQCQ